MTKFELAVRVIADELEAIIKEDYDDRDIDNWDDMLHSFGWDTQDAKSEICYYLEDYSNKNNIDIMLDVDYELENGDELVSYRKLTNEVRKEMKNRKIFK